MKNNVLDVTVSLFASVQTNTPISEISLYEFLRDEQYKQKYLPLVQEYRTTGKDELKKQLPAVTVSGTFDKRNTDGLKEHSGLICIDVDAKDNTHLQDFNELHQTIVDLPYVAYCGRSVSGKGYFVIIPISDPQRHKEHFEALKKAFYNSGVVIDGNCGDITRLRIYSYDPNAYIKLDAQVYDKKADAFQMPTKPTVKNKNMTPLTVGKMARVICEIVEVQIDITDEYKRWVEIASVFYNEFGEAGRVLFHIVSRINAKYNEVNANKQFDNVIGKPYPYSIGTFFKYAEDAGINIK